MLRVAVLAPDDVVPFDLAVPCEVFGRVRVDGVAWPYEVVVCSDQARVRAGPFDIACRHGLDALVGAQTIVVPGIGDLSAPPSCAIVDALRAAADRGARIASLCTGAFLLAATGLLDGLRATTHWMAAPELARRHPAVSVDPDVLFVDNGRILTSAGAAAALDLCLHMVRRDYGAAAAADIARLSVMPLERAGGQKQFVVAPPPAAPASLAPLLDWMTANLDADLRLDTLARQAGMSLRTFSRRFRAQAGTTPLQWLLAARVRRAQQLLETTALSVERIATTTGFESAGAFRARFARCVGTSPTQYRRAFSAPDGAEADRAST